MPISRVPRVGRVYQNNYVSVKLIRIFNNQWGGMVELEVFAVHQLGNIVGNTYSISSAIFRESFLQVRNKAIA